MLQGNSQLWGSEWVADDGNYGALFETGDFSKSLFEAACNGSSPPGLVIEGRSLSELAFDLMEAIKAAAERGDFTPILSTDRMFRL